VYRLRTHAQDPFDPGGVDVLLEQASATLLSHMVACNTCHAAIPIGCHFYLLLASLRGLHYTCTGLALHLH
jgi:hypothetical protein